MSPKNVLKTCLVLIFIIGGISCTEAQHTSKGDLKIWFNEPAADWNTALPVGNGKLGAMIFGGVEKERIQLNEESVWSGREEVFHNPKAQEGLKETRKLIFEGKYGEAEKVGQEKLMGDKKSYATYQTLGDLEFVFPKPEKLTSYKRELDLETAIATVSYINDGAFHKREIFSSAPDQALIIRLTSEKMNSVNFSINLTRPGRKASVEMDKDGMTLTEHVSDGNGVVLYARYKIVLNGGVFSADANGLKVERANIATIFLTAATNYKGKNPEQITLDNLNKVVKKPYEQIRITHIMDYQSLFNRVDLDLGKVDSLLLIPTDDRLKALKEGREDAHLLKLYYQFGRYLLISSSRPGSMPANLQGIWADGLNVPWSGDYHININIQMNYWPAEVTNLSELHMPFLNFINDLRPNARRVAKDMYGLEGTVAHFSTDAWFYAEPHGKTDWAMWPMGMAWSCQHVWEHYLFTGDKEYLKNFAYPILKDAAIFCKGWLVTNPKTGKLVSGPSISPENKFYAPKGNEVVSMVMGPTMDHMIIRELLTNTIEAAKVINVDNEFREQLKLTLANLSPTQVTSDGRIMEWTEEFKEFEPGHRHISHLYGLHPSNQITNKTPELMTAAKKTIEFRLSNGGGHTGWSRAWIINFYARMQDSKNAYSNLQALLKKSTLDNLFDNHPPFQIDGNFGATAGITEMLIQSHAGEIQLLPALPEQWQKGYIKGIVARGGFEVTIQWENGKLKRVNVLSKLGNDCILRYEEKVVNMKTEKGKTYSFDGSLVVK